MKPIIKKVPERVLLKPTASVPERVLLKNKFYIKYYMRKAGNDSPELKKEINDILIKLEKLLK